MLARASHPPGTICEARDKTATGRGQAVVAYALMLATIMTLVTALLAALLAHWQIGRSARWVETHFRFLVRTFWFGLAGLAAALAAWQGLGIAGAPPVAAWSFGYLVITVWLAWTLGRCAVGIHRLLGNRPIDRPRSLLFGGSGARG